MSGLLHLTEADLAGLGISQAEIVDTLTDAIRAEAAGNIWTSPKTVVLPGDGRYMMTTLSASDDPAVSVVKFVMISLDNETRGLPAINGSIMLHDSRSGALRAVLDANWITAVRTAGLSGVAARALANPASARIGFIGAGVQARSHLDLFAELFPVEEIAIFSRGQTNKDILSAKAEGMGLSVTHCDSAEAAIRDADLVVTSVTATTVPAPFLDGGWLKPGAFAAVTDLGVPWMPGTMGGLGRAVIDDRAQENAAEAKLIDPALVTGDLKDLVSGRIETGHDPARPSAFLFRGIAIGDFAISALAWQRAQGA